MKFYFPPMNKFGNQAFRTLCLNSGADAVFTELIRVDKLLQNDEVQLRKANVDKSQITKTIFQILTENIELIEMGVLKLKQLNSKIKEVNYNMGCPQSTLCKNFNGGGILRNTKRIQEVAQKLFDICTKEYIIPSIKIRIGISKDEITIYENLKLFEEIGIKKIYIHGRTLSDTYSKSANYDEIKKAIEMFPNLEIVANGDIVGTQSFNEVEKIKPFGVAIGRAALENPLIFKFLKEEKEFEFNQSGEDLKLRKELILEYLKYVKKHELNISYIKANLAYLTKNCVGAAQIRKEINEVNSVKEIEKICKNI